MRGSAHARGFRGTKNPEGAARHQALDLSLKDETCREHRLQELVSWVQMQCVRIDQMLNLRAGLRDQVVEIYMGQIGFSSGHYLANDLQLGSVNDRHVGLPAHELLRSNPRLNKGQPPGTKGAVHALCSQSDLGQGEVAEGTKEHQSGVNRRAHFEVTQIPFPNLGSGQTKSRGLNHLGVRIEAEHLVVRSQRLQVRARSAGPFQEPSALHSVSEKQFSNSAGIGPVVFALMEESVELRSVHLQGLLRSHSHASIITVS